MRRINPRQQCIDQGLDSRRAALAQQLDRGVYGLQRFVIRNSEPGPGDARLQQSDVIGRQGRFRFDDCPAVDTTRGCKLAALPVSIADRDPQLQQLIRAAFELGVDAPLDRGKQCEVGGL